MSKRNKKQSQEAMSQAPLEAVERTEKEQNQAEFSVDYRETLAENMLSDEQEEAITESGAEPQEVADQSKSAEESISADENSKWEIPESPKELGKKKGHIGYKGKMSIFVKKTTNGATVPVRLTPSPAEEGALSSNIDGMNTEEKSVAEKQNGGEAPKKKIADFFEKSAKEKTPHKGELPYHGWFERPAIGGHPTQLEQEKEDASVLEGGKKDASYAEVQKKAEHRKNTDFSVDYRSETEQPVEDRLGDDDDTEIDDFLAEGNSDDQLLAKWTDEDPHKEAPNDAVRTSPRRKGTHRYGIAVGSLVLLMALVGVVFIAGSIGKNIYNTATDDSALRQYDAFLTPIVMQDPSPFENSTKADEEFVLNASLWKAITADDGTNYKESDSSGRALVPLGEVVDACHELFGPDCQLQPKSPVEETFFEYNSDENMFHVSRYSSDSSYTPYTEKSRRRGDTVALRVGYVSPSDEWRNQTNSGLSGPLPTKHMKYVLKLNSSTGKYYVFSIQAEANQPQKS